MARATTQQEVFWPAPTQGMVTEVTHVQEPVRFARFLRNAVVSSGSIRQRHAQQAFVDQRTSSVVGYRPIWFDIAADEFLYDDGTIRDTAGSTVYVTGFSTSLTRVIEGSFRNQLFLFSPFKSLGGAAAVQRNNGTWGAFNYTLSTLTAGELDGSVEYKGRVYFWGYDASTAEVAIEYSGLSAITGATTYYPITAFLKADEHVAFCQAVTIEAGLNTGEVFVVYGSAGSVLVFDGETPATWVLTARYIMSAPAATLYWSFVKIEGDVIVMATDYIYSTRSVFTSGSQASSENALSRPVASLYKDLVRKTIGNLGSYNTVFATYLDTHNALVFSLGYASDIMASDDADYTGAYTKLRRVQLVYFRDMPDEQPAWALWDIPQLNWPMKKGFYSGTEYNFWTSGRQLFHYNLLPTSSSDTIEIGGTNTDTSGIEMVWTAPILSSRVMQNAHIHGVRAFIYQMIVTAVQISALGMVGGGKDAFYNASDLNFKFLRDDDSIIDSKSIIQISQPKVATERLHQVFANVALQDFFCSPTIRINKATGSPGDFDNTGTLVNEVYGMTVYFTPGGIF